MTPRSRRRGLFAGLLAAGPALAAIVLGRLVTDRPGLIEVVSDGFSGLLPLDLFEALLATFGPLAKGLLTLGIAAGILLAGAVVGDLALRVTARRQPAIAGALVAASALLAVELAVLPLFRAGFLGFDLRSDPLAVQAPLLVAALLYGAVLIGLRETWLAASSVSAPEPEQPHLRPTPAIGEVSRRRFIGSGLLVIGGAALAGSVAALLSQVLSTARRGGAPEVADFDPGGFGPTPGLTPVADFYTVNKNVLATEVDGASWALVIDGLVERPESLTLAQLSALPYHETYRTLECISTDIVRGDHLIGNQRWRGVRVSDLLERVGVRPEASWILWEADDGFTESLPLAVARHPDTWIAYDMGDAPLTAEHGYPARVLIAGRFGMKQPKWLRRMQLADHDEDGYWEQRSWDRDAFERTMSRIDWPRVGATVETGVPFTASGIAFAGDRGISRVEVSPDGGATWLEANLEDATVPPLAELSWLRWRVDLSVVGPGAAELAVRATDGEGATQSGARTSPLPSGSTGWHRVEVVAVAA